jgi:hypothetical protein
MAPGVFGSRTSGTVCPFIDAVSASPESRRTKSLPLSTDAYASMVTPSYVCALIDAQRSLVAIAPDVGGGGVPVPCALCEQATTTGSTHRKNDAALMTPPH